MSTTSWSALRQQAKETAKTTGTFEPVPVGEYDVEVVECTTGFAGTGAASWKLKCRVTSGPQEDRLVWCDIYLNTDKPGSVTMFFDQMETIGIADMFDAEPSNEQVADAISGRSLRLRLKKDTYNGKVGTKVDRILPATGVTAPAAAAPEPTPNAAPSGDVKPPF